MAFVTSPISFYKVVLYGQQGAPGIGAFIHCFHEGRNVVSCVFYDSATVPDNHWAGGDHRVNLHYPMAKFDAILDVLRNEKPVYFGFISDNNLGYISTHNEPTGEEES